MFDTFFFIDVKSGIYEARYGPYTDLNEAIVLMCDYGEKWLATTFPRKLNKTWIYDHPITLIITEQIHTAEGFEIIAERCRETRDYREDFHR